MGKTASGADFAQNLRSRAITRNQNYRFISQETNAVLEPHLDGILWITTTREENWNTLDIRNMTVAILGNTPMIVLLEHPKGVDSDYIDEKEYIIRHRLEDLGIRGDDTVMIRYPENQPVWNDKSFMEHLGETMDSHFAKLNLDNREETLFLSERMVTLTAARLRDEDWRPYQRFRSCSLARGVILRGTIAMAQECATICQPIMRPQKATIVGLLTERQRSAPVRDYSRGERIEIVLNEGLGDDVFAAPLLSSQSVVFAKRVEITVKQQLYWPAAAPVSSERNRPFRDLPKKKLQLLSPTGLKWVHARIRGIDKNRNGESVYDLELSEYWPFAPSDFVYVSEYGQWTAGGHVTGFAEVFVGWD